MEIGAKLREAREEKNISLDELQEKTKIQKRYLVAIEEGNFHILPGTFYARAFIKEYATAVGLDPYELLEGHQSEIPPKEQQSEITYSRLQRSRSESRSTRSTAFLSVLPKIIVVVLIIVVLFVAFMLYLRSVEPDQPADQIEKSNGNNEIVRNRGNSDNQSSIIDDDANDREDDHDSLDNDDEGLNQEENDEDPVIEEILVLIDQGSGSTPESIFELQNVEEQVIITFEPTGASWIDVMDNAGNYIYRGNTEANTPVEVDVSDVDRFRINVGFAPELPVIMINDIQLEYPHDPNQFFTQRIWIEKTNDEEGVE